MKFLSEIGGKCINSAEIGKVTNLESIKKILDRNRIFFKKVEIGEKIYVP